MTRHEKEITHEQYRRGVENHGYVDERDREDIFTDAERLGYGVYSDHVHERDGKFYVSYLLGDSCD